MVIFNSYVKLPEGKMGYNPYDSGILWLDTTIYTFMYSWV